MEKCNSHKTDVMTQTFVFYHVLCLVREHITNLKIIITSVSQVGLFLVCFIYYMVLLMISKKNDDIKLKLQDKAHFWLMSSQFLQMPKTLAERHYYSFWYIQAKVHKTHKDHCPCNMSLRSYSLYLTYGSYHPHTMCFVINPHIPKPPPTQPAKVARFYF